MLAHLPPLQIRGFSLHSSTSTQDRPSRFRAKPVLLEENSKPIVTMTIITNHINIKHTRRSKRSCPACSNKYPRNLHCWSRTRLYPRNGTSIQSVGNHRRICTGKCPSCSRKHRSNKFHWSSSIRRCPCRIACQDLIRAQEDTGT